MVEKLARGFVTDYPDRNPPKSAAGFEWPGPKRANDAQRAAFRKVFSNTLRGGWSDHIEFAREFWGETRDGKGYVIPRGRYVPLEWSRGNQFPMANTARQLAAFLKVPMERLLTDDGTPYVPLSILRRSPGSTKASLKSANGHAGNGAAGLPIVSPAAPAAGSAAAPPRRPPKGAKPVTVEIKTVADATDWCHVSISGTVPLDVGLGIMAFIDRHKDGPRR